MQRRCCRLDSVLLIVSWLLCGTISVDAAQLLDTGPALGDQGLVEDAIRGGITTVIDAVKQTDLNIADKAQDIAKSVGKHSQDVAKSVGKHSQDVAKTVGKHMLDGAKTVGNAIKTTAINQAGSLADEMVPAFNQASAKKSITGVKGAPRNSPAAAGTGVHISSPRQDQVADTTAEIQHVQRMIASSFSEPSGEDAFLQSMSQDHNNPFGMGPAGGDQDANMGTNYVTALHLSSYLCQCETSYN